jgi:hypothetical protein
MNLSSFKLTAAANTYAYTTTDIRVRVAGQDLVASTDGTCSLASEDMNGDYCVDSNKNIIVKGLSEEIPTAGVDVEVIAKTELAE